MTRKQEFIAEYENSVRLFGTITKMVVAIQLPTGAKELIINTDNIESKYKYYLDNYNEDLELYSNKDVKLLGMLFI